MSEAILRQTPVVVTGPYGPRKLPNGADNFHEGTDHGFGSAMGVSSYGDGVVVASPRTKPDRVYGWYVRVRHAPGIETSYHSLLRPALKKVGEPVKMGDILGYGGASAMAAEGNHVHVGLWLNGHHRDERDYLAAGQPVRVVVNGDVINSFPVDASSAGSISTPFPDSPEEDDMFSDADRAVLADVKKAVEAQRPAADYSLVRLSDKPEVFISTNRETLRWVKTERELELVRYTLDGVGAPAAKRPVEVVGDLPPYGTIIGERPADPAYANL
jgi:hypothetical protein